MMRSSKVAVVALPMVGLLMSGCAARKVDFSSIKQPARSSELDAFNVFEGSWDWQAEMVNAEEPDKKWTGTAEWKWTLDKRCLHGVMTAKSSRTSFEAAGVWSWHPTHKKYIWWMFNNWGYPQEGNATYDAGSKTWKMTYTSVGLDGTTSHGCYEMKVADDKTLNWKMEEWADALHMVKKTEMTGKYTKRK